MATGQNFCPICRHFYNIRNESILKVKSVKNCEGKQLYDYVCLSCCNKIKNIENLEEIILINKSY